MFYNDGNIFLATYVKAFEFVKRFDINSNSDKLFEILPIKDFLDNF